MDENHGNDQGRKEVSPKGGWSTYGVRMTIYISAAAFILLAGGFIYGAFVGFGGVVGTKQPEAEPGQSSDSLLNTTVGSNKQTKIIHLVALGDSLTHGTGDASGIGYVGNVSHLYRQNGCQVIESNLGIGGLTSSGLLAEMKQVSILHLLQTANIILISIGGNDLFEAAGLPNINPYQISTAQNRFDKNLTAILTTIRKQNRTAPVVLVGLYNPYGNISATVRQTDAIVESWNLREQKDAVQFSNTVVAQTFDLFQLHPDQFLYGDHFHPNQAGYQRIAERIWEDLQ